MKVKVKLEPELEPELLVLYPWLYLPDGGSYIQRGGNGLAEAEKKLQKSNWEDVAAIDIMLRTEFGKKISELQATMPSTTDLNNQ